GFDFEALTDRVAGEASIRIPAFVPQSQVKAPPAATHLCLTGAACSIDFRQGAFQQDLVRSEWIAVSPQPTDELELTAGLAADTEDPVFLALGITFGQELNGIMYPLRNGAFNALAVVAVDTL